MLQHTVCKTSELQSDRVKCEDMSQKSLLFLQVLDEQTLLTVVVHCCGNMSDEEDDCVASGCMMQA